MANGPQSPKHTARTARTHVFLSIVHTLYNCRPRCTDPLKEFRLSSCQRSWILSQCNKRCRHTRINDGADGEEHLEAQDKRHRHNDIGELSTVVEGWVSEAQVKIAC